MMRPETSKPSIIRDYYVIVIAFLLACLYALFSGYNAATKTGYLCAVFFLLGNTYVPVKRLRYLITGKDVAEEMNLLLGWHCLFNIFAFFLCFLHCYLAQWVNLWLKVSIVLMGWLVLGGFFLKYKYSAALKRGIYFLHSQQFVFLLLLFAVLKGHYFF